MTQLMETHRSCVYQLSEDVQIILSKVTPKANKNLSKFLHNFESLTNIQLKILTEYIVHYTRDMIFKQMYIYYEFKKGVGIDSATKSTETRILLPQFSLQKFNPYFWLII